MTRELKSEINYNDFDKIDIRIGKIINAEMVPDTDKLIKCTIDFGELGERTIISGIREFIEPEDLVGKKLPYVVNLAPRKLMGVISEGMLLAGAPDIGDGLHGLSLLEVTNDTPPGTTIG